MEYVILICQLALFIYTYRIYRNLTKRILETEQEVRNELDNMLKELLTEEEYRRFIAKQEASNERKH